MCVFVCVYVSVWKIEKERERACSAFTLELTNIISISFFLPLLMKSSEKCQLSRFKDFLNKSQFLLISLIYLFLFTCIIIIQIDALGLPESHTVVQVAAPLFFICFFLSSTLFPAFFFCLCCHPEPSTPLTYPIMTYSIVAYPCLYNPILSWPILSHPILSYPILTYRMLSYPILSYPILSYLILSYIIVSYLI